MKRYPIEAGLAVRKQVRRYLLGLGVKFIEDKGWFESMFYVDCESPTIQRINLDLAQWQEDMKQASSPKSGL